MTDYDELLDKAQEEAPEDLDTEERFEIPEVMTRKDGSKTVLENFKEIAEKFSREQKHVSKYVLNELGTAGHINDNNELILNGEFRRGHITSKIENYAEEYVYCGECSRPDTQLKKEKGVEIMKCQACGARTPI